LKQITASASGAIRRLIMARPKTGKPPKRSLNLTVDEKTREILAAISAQRGLSISALVEEWAAKEAQKGNTNV